jgi:phosphonate metabolism protein/1,5-bisphosphokinase (PRPP-forming) PhnN
MSGTLYLVVGPSGAGKDAVIDGARASLDGDPRFLFARRVVTRPADAGGERHEAATVEDFARREAAGGFCLTWRAHGLAYGLPADLEGHLAAGTSVIANVSRSVIDDARRRFPLLRIVVVTAPPEVLAARLVARGREDAAAIAERLAREVPVASGPDVTVITNDGPLSRAVDVFVDTLLAGLAEARAAGSPR